MGQLAQEIRVKLNECFPGHGGDRVARATELGYFFLRIAPDVLQSLDAEPVLVAALQRAASDIVAWCDANEQPGVDHVGINDSTLVLQQINAALALCRHDVVV